MSMKGCTIFVLMLMLAPIAFGQCTSWESSPLWIWNPVYWQNSGSESTADIEGATAGWRNASAAVTISDDQSYDDVDINDDNSQTGVGYTQVWNPTNWMPGTYPSACINQYDSCGYCRNSSVAIKATIRLSPSNISEDQMNYPNWDADEWTIWVLSHEMGHALNLDDYYFSPTNCNYTTTMYSDGLGDYNCGINVAQSYCDGGATQSEYGSASFESYPCYCGYGAC